MKLKYCQITEEVISAALWMPFGNFNRCFFHLNDYLYVLSYRYTRINDMSKAFMSYSYHADPDHIL